MCQVTGSIKAGYKGDFEADYVSLELSGKSTNNALRSIHAGEYSVMDKNHIWRGY